jgi:hypothetical protein
MGKSTISFYNSRLHLINLAQIIAIIVLLAL